jgi:hypothetical protein
MEEQYNLNSLPKILLLFVFIGVIAGIGIYLLTNLGATTGTITQTLSIVGINSTNTSLTSYTNLTLILPTS